LTQPQNVDNIFLAISPKTKEGVVSVSTLIFTLFLYLTAVTVTINLLATIVCYAAAIVGFSADELIHCVNRIKCPNLYWVLTHLARLAGP
jgi:hypothetical protein